VDDVARVLRHYPRIYFACHAWHRRDPESGNALSERFASILDHLDPVEGVTLKDLAAHMGVTPGTMSISVARLVEGGWVRRDLDAADARKVSLRLTRAGVRMRAARSLLDPARVERVLARLTAAERAQALHGLSLLAQAASQEMAESKRE
jgi:DNA-binding MarR family transcriptional regulator